MSETRVADLDHIANPYDFANPVSSKELFIGRDKERKDIEYYLDLTRNSDRSINLALLGERASGKTSLLNIIELEAMDRALVPVRIDLNESDVSTHFAFWFKLFDAIVNRIVDEKNADGVGHIFGGIDGKTYDTYLNLISAYAIPDDKTFCPFLFPIQFAKAMGAGNAGACVSDQILKRDLKRIAAEVGRPIVLLIDECNILSSQRALLEMVRNTFMNLAGYMLVFTGTPDLFPLMDEVFSPNVRQFKRIEVAPFADIRETMKGVSEPLKSIGRENLFPMSFGEFRKASPYGFHIRAMGGDLQDLHDLTGGKPYEIQLVCHFMFKRVQLGRDTHMRLSFEVLEDVLSELRQSHDVDARPVLSAVKALESADLRALGVLLQSGGRVPVGHLIFASVTTMETDASPSELSEAFERFVQLRILSDIQGCASFRGDDFDRIVCKYAARQRKIHLSFESRPVSEFFEHRMLLSEERVDGSADNASGHTVPKIFSVFSPSRDSEGELPLLSAAWDSIGTDWTVIDLFRHIPNLIGEVYPDFADKEEEFKSGFALLRLDVSGAGVAYTGYFCRVHQSIRDASFSDVLSAFEEMRQRAESVGGSVSFDRREFGGATLDDVFELVQGFADEGALRHCAHVHVSEMVHSYLDKGERRTALIHASRAAKGLRCLGDDDLNNIGYVFLSCDRLQEAAEALNIVHGRAAHQSLAKYNLGLVQLKWGERDSARELFNEVLRIEKEKSHPAIAVLLVPEYVEGKLTIEEHWPKSQRPNSDHETICLSDCARHALDVLAKMDQRDVT